MAVDLGFIDKSVKLLESRFFPSKVGGKPAWLDLKDIPLTEQLICAACNSPMYFLCQLYCPINGKDTAFHRTIFVFLCTSKDCFHPNSGTNFVVYRNQLPKCNPYYSDSPPVEDLSWRPDITPAKFDTQVCTRCGIRSKYQCKGRVEWFCSAKHELYSKSVVILPEYGLSIEPENEVSNEESDDEEQVVQINIADYDIRFEELRKLASAQDDPTVEQIFSECSEKTQDEVFSHFKRCVEAQPDQVIRYDRDGEPLWLSAEHIPAKIDIPKCEYCGKCRIFEFQIMPQLLNHLNFDQEISYSAGSVDWGTLAIYTCQDSCDEGPAYKKEFLWKQDILN